MRYVEVCCLVDAFKNIPAKTLCVSVFVCVGGDREMKDKDRMLIIFGAG